MVTADPRWFYAPIRASPELVCVRIRGNKGQRPDQFACSRALRTHRQMPELKSKREAAFVHVRRLLLIARTTSLVTAFR